MRGRSRTVALSAVLLATVAMLSGWLEWSSRTAANVVVSWSPASPRCTGTAVQRSGPHSPLFDARKTMRCVIEVRVANRGTRTIHIARAVAPFVGPETGMVVTAQNTGRSAQSGRAIDAVFPLADDLGAGESMTFDVILLFNPAGCNSPGTMWVPGWPTVTVEALGRSHDISSDQDLAFRRRGADPGCLS